MPINQPFEFRSQPPAIKGLIVANVAVFLAQLVGGAALTRWLGLSPARVLNDFWLWQIGTYMFLHGGIFHLLFNMYVLWTFGRELEFRWGASSFLWYYLVCGWGAAVFNVLLAPGQVGPSIGASGAIYGVLVAFAVVFPEAVLYVYFLIPMKARHLVILFAAVEFLAGASGAASGIANLAHLGGMLTGFLYLKGDAWTSGWRGFWARRRQRRPAAVRRGRPAPSQDLAGEVDRILDKILKEGLDSLTPEERALMDRYSKMKK